LWAPMLWPLTAIRAQRWISTYGLSRREKMQKRCCPLRRFGTPLRGLTLGDLQADGTIFQIGVAPRRIDIITGASGLRFEEAFARSTRIHIEGLQVRIPSIDDLILNKRASGRTKDLADAEALESLKVSEKAQSPASRRPGR
jgi:hypothetical protein